MSMFSFLLCGAIFSLRVISINAISNSKLSFPVYNGTIKRAESDALIANFRASIVGAVFSGVFTNNTVLQATPHIAAIYGAADTPNTEINFQISDDNSDYYENINAISDSQSNWKLFLSKPMAYGGTYTISIKCPKCASNNATTVSLYNITFGDVYYCAGQSNMELDMHYTFSRNNTYDAIRSGLYKNIRYMTMYEIDTSVETWVVPQTTNADNHWVPYPNNNTLDKFSAVCWYFAQSLYDIYNITSEDHPIGLIDVSVGGTMIEQWTQNQTVQLVCKDSLCPDEKCGGLFNGLVASYINMTIKGLLWYQGENNVYETPGSWHNDTGYGCMEPFMLQQWRNLWSVAPNTTDSDIPFGLVSLAAGTDEGHGDNMAPFRWAQTGNVDYMPNFKLTNTFIALAHDLGDPWNEQCFYLKPPTCQGDSPYSWNKTNYYMGPIHPRVKLAVGQRLARAGYKLLYQKSSYNPTSYLSMGPLINGCKMDLNQAIINISFNSSYLMNGEISVDIVPFIAWYNESINSNTISETSAMEVLIDNGKQWVNVNITKDLNNVGNNINANISKFIQLNETITGLRYAWSTYPCCGTLNRDYNPCPPNSCPIQAFAKNRQGNNGNGNYSLPAVPFWAKIINNTCHCFVPQTCNAFKDTPN